MSARGGGGLRRLAAALILLALLVARAGVQAQENFLIDAERRWADARDIRVPEEKERQGFRLLRLVMEGGFSAQPVDALGARIMAAALPLLAAIQPEDIPAFAEAYRLPEALVEQSYWLSLAETLRASLRLQTDGAGKASRERLHRWLEAAAPSGSEDPQAPREAVDEETVLDIAREYGLPLRFVRFLAAGAETEGPDTANQPAATAQTAETRPGTVSPQAAPGNGPAGGPTVKPATPKPATPKPTAQTPKPESGNHGDQSQGGQEGNGAETPGKQR